MTSSRRQKQQEKEKMEKAERSKALLSPDSLPVVYTDLRSKAVETKPLAEFLAWAKEEKVLIFTQAYHDSLFSKKPSRTVGNVKLLCPSIERDCTLRNGIAEVAAAFYAERNALFVDNMYSATYKKAVSVIIHREKTLRRENELLESEAACSESNKTVEVAADCESIKLAEVASDAAQDTYNEGLKMKGSAKSQAQAVCQQDAKESISNEAEAKVVEGETSKGYAQGCVNVDKGISNEEGPAEQVVDGDSSKERDDADRISFEGWLLQLEKGKKAVPYDTILVELLKSSQVTTGALQSMKESLDLSFTTLQAEVSGMKAEVIMLRSEVKSAHKAISDNGESIARVSLAQFLQEKSVPIFGRKLPFVYFEPLEDLANLCLTGARKSRSLPTDVEIDIFVKVMENAKGKYMYSPPRAPYRVSDQLTTEYGFTSFIIGENTRSGIVCNDAYSHPLKADYSGFTKLLYKFIQVERALIATREYYYVGEDYMEAGLIVSPSFKNMSNSHELIDQVLAGRAQAFPNIAHLHAKGRMWLTSM